MVNWFISLVSIFLRNSTRHKALFILVIVLCLWIFHTNMCPERPFQYPLEINMTRLVHNLRSRRSQSQMSMKMFYETLDVPPINIYYFKYFSLPFKKCISSQFIFLIKSSLKNYRNRRLFRSYFSSLKGKYKFSFRWIFFVGKVSTSFQRNIFDDVVQVDIVDSYFNNTLKLCAEIFWLYDNLCNESSHQRILLIDDDVFINFDNMEYLLKPQFNRRAIFGHLYDESSPYRMSWSKWFISTKEYSNDFYPPYISGSTIVMNRETLTEVNFAIPYVKHIPFDDVYLGIVAKKLNLEVVNEERILIDHRCGIFCLEDLNKSIAVHITRDFDTLHRLMRKYSS